MDLDSTVQTLADRLGRPVIIFDTDFEVAAFSIHYDDVDSARLSMILSRKGSERAIRLMRDHRVDHATGAVFVPAQEGAPPRIVTALRYEGHLTGYVSYVPGADEDPAQRDAPLIATTRDDIGTILAARAVARKNDAGRLSETLALLLRGDDAQQRSAAERLIRDGDISSAAHYAVMVFRAAHTPEDTRMRAELVLGKALAAIPRFSSLHAAGALLGEEGVLLIPHEVSLERMRKLLANPGFASVRGGGGGTVTSLVEAAESYRQALVALRGATLDPARYGPAAVWDELGIDRLLLQMPLERITRADLPAPVRALLQTAAGAELTGTLEAYLDNGADAQRTANQLHIHRSTLYYRLDRVRALIGVDLADGIVRRELHTALRVAQLAGLLEPAPETRP